MKKIIKKLIPNKIMNKLDEYFFKRIKSKLRNTDCNYKISIDSSKKFEGKTVIVTGGSGAIGSAICFKLAAEGAIVGVCGRSKNTVEPIVNKINESLKTFGGEHVVPILLDVTDEKNIEKSFDEFSKKYGKIDILINNAGGGARNNSKPLAEQNIETIDMVLNSNLRGTMLCSRIAVRYMIKQNYGKITNIGSTAGVGGIANYSEYTASKSGIIGFTKALAMEVGKYNINVNCVSPGKVQQIIFDKPVEPDKTNKCYLGRIGKTDDIANVVEFLVSDEASYITGQNIIVDGGRSLGLKGD